MKSIQGSSGTDVVLLKTESKERAYEKPSGLSTLSIQGSSGTDVVLLKTESKERAYVNTVDTKIKACNAFNAMFVDTVDTGVCGSTRCQCRQTRYPTQYTIVLL